MRRQGAIEEDGSEETLVETLRRYCESLQQQLDRAKEEQGLAEFRERDDAAKLHCYETYISEMKRLTKDAKKKLQQANQRVKTLSDRLTLQFAIGGKRDL